MKKLFIAATTFVLLSTASFAETPTENRDKMEAMHHHFMMMTQKMMNSEMAMLKKQEAMLTNYQKLLKQMMENETNHKN